MRWTFKTSSRINTANSTTVGKTMLQLCLPQKIDGTNRPLYVTSPLLSPKGVSVKRGVRVEAGAGVGVGVYPVFKKNIILGLGLVSTLTFTLTPA